MIVEVENYELLKNVVEYASRLNDIEKHNCKSCPVGYDNMLEYFNKKMNHADKKILAYIEEGEITGVTAIGAVPESKYLQTEGGFFAENNYQEVANKFFEFIKHNYTGYEFYSAYSSDNDEAIKFMRSVGAECIDDHIIYRINLDQYEIIDTSSVTSLTEEFYDQFFDLHNKNFPTMYWNSKRLLDSLVKFDIKVILKDNVIIGYVISNLWNKDENEIYAIYSEGNDSKVLTDLVYASTNTQKLRGNLRFQYFSEREDKFEHIVLEECGYNRVGTSVCYHIDKI